MPITTSTIDTAAYLTRIGYAGPLEPTVDTLRALHRAHLLAVLFENLDIHPPFHCEITLELERLEEKIVEAQRGGFCYELNGLFAALLETLGFNVTLLSAGVRRAEGGFGPAFDHLLLRVDVDGEAWLADVGFGDSFLEPIRLTDTMQHDVHGGTFRIDAEHEARGDGLILRRLIHEDWEPQYRFRLAAYALEDFAEMCRFQQSSPDSVFTRSRVCSRFTPTGRVSLTDTRLIVTEGRVRAEYPVEGDDAFLAALADHFGIAPIVGK